MVAKWYYMILEGGVSLSGKECAIKSKDYGFTKKEVGRNYS
jgi:hypothetical protein